MLRWSWDHSDLKVAPPLDLDHRDWLNSPPQKKSFDVRQITNREPSIIEWMRRRLGLKVALPLDLDHRDGLNSLPPPKKKKVFDVQQITNKEPSIIEWMRCGPYYWQLINLELMFSNLLVHAGSTLEFRPTWMETFSFADHTFLLKRTNRPFQS